MRGKEFFAARRVSEAATVKTYDVIIVGAGTAGLSARREVAKMTDNYLVVDGGPLGTTCARVGCMPSKALLEAANTFHRRTRFQRLGIAGADQLRVSSSAVLRHVRTLRDHFVDALLRDMDEWAPTHLLREHVRFTSPDTLASASGPLHAGKFILATGSSPVVPEAWKAHRALLLDTEQLFALNDLPASVAVIGSGVIGLELGQALARLGVDVVVFGKPGPLGGLTDPAVSQRARAIFGAEFSLVASAVDQLHAVDGKVHLDAGGTRRSFDRALVALGRKANYASLALQNAGVALDDEGQPTIEPHTRRVMGSRLYVAGDASDERMILHEAADDGRIAGWNALRPADEAFRKRTRLTITFSSPQLAVVGKSHRSLTEEKADFVAGSVDFEKQGRALVQGENQGLLTIYADRKSGRLLGAELCAPAGEHLAHLLAWIVDGELTVFEALQLPFYHPVVEEGLRTALRDLGKKVAVSPPDLDLRRCSEAMPLSNLSD